MTKKIATPGFDCAWCGVVLGPLTCTDCYVNALLRLPHVARDVAVRIVDRLEAADRAQVAADAAEVVS